jgi:hypothetical protein
MTNNQLFAAARITAPWFVQTVDSMPGTAGLRSTSILRRAAAF